MTAMSRPRWPFVRLLPLAGCLLSAGCGGNHSALDPAGPGAARIGDIWWLMLFVCAAVFGLVMLVLLWAIVRRRRPRVEGTSEAARPDPRRERILARGVSVAVAVTVSIVFLFVIASYWVARALVAQPTEAALKIDVTGQRWWWDVRYRDPLPSREFSTANEIHIPVGRPVELTLRSVDVIHSFWVPSLQGKKDLIPGQVNTLWLQADLPGVFRGQCAEFCGLQHAHMALEVVAEPEDDFTRWQAQQLKPAPEPATDEQKKGRDVFMTSSCVLCHAIAGTSAGGVAGPNLTHLASRRSLAAGTMPNTRGHLAGWIVDPQLRKPGSNMPPNPLRGDELQALLGYLETLR
jgi:cytochrome c oxidase subunit 2